jgi:hypothetical protein
VLGAVATAPGLVVLVVDAFRRRRLDRVPAVPDETVPVITSPAPVPPAPLAG